MKINLDITYTVEVQDEDEITDEQAKKQAECYLFETCLFNQQALEFEEVERVSYNQCLVHFVA